MTLVVSDLQCRYNGRAVFAGVSLAVRPGELLSVLGPNGAGKTTLLKAMARLVAPAAGRVALDGTDVRSWHPAALAATVAFAPQAHAPDWPFTAWEFVALGRVPHRGWWRPLSAVDRRAVAAALDRLELGPHRHRSILELSGGEWQRVRLAQALARRPRVLLLDEPTAHLDPRFQLELLTLLRELTQEDGIGVAVAMHDLNLVGSWADRVALLAGGRLVAEGPPDAVLTPEILAAAYGVRFAIAPHPLTAAPAISFAARGRP
jgi:iron complex transport system ATP-binding protein